MKIKPKKIIIVLLITAAAVLAASMFIRADVLPGLEETEALGQTLGLWSLAPTILAVALAFLTGDVILSLLAGVLLGAAMLTAVSGNGGAYATFDLAVNSIVDITSDRDKVQVLLLCVVVGGMEGVIRYSAGFETAARKLSLRLKSPGKVNLVSQLFCTLFFFDDYANALISGPVLTPVTDNAGISREKLSYIVDSTAAPLAGIAVISSWVAVEVSVIQEGLDIVGAEVSAFHIFFNSIPYCFYCIFALAFVFLLTVTGKEFGPMLEAERRARAGQPVKANTHLVKTRTEEMPVSDGEGRSWTRIALAFGSILLMLAFAIGSFYITGKAEAVAQGLISADAGFSFGSLSTIIGCADTIHLVMEAAIIAGIAALLGGTLLGLFTLSEGINAWLEGASSLVSTIVVLVLAWTLAGAVQQLGTVYFVVDIISSGVSSILVPTLIFLTCCLVSFAAGSYGCMFMIMPIAVPIVAAISGINAQSVTDPFMLSCVAAVLSGAIFGDHCSPMTDCTILAALGAGCETMDHVRTQMPYAICVAVTSVLCGTLLTSLGIPVAIALIVGTAFMLGTILILGKKV